MATRNLRRIIRRAGTLALMASVIAFGMEAGAPPAPPSYPVSTKYISLPDFVAADVHPTEPDDREKPGKHSETASGSESGSYWGPLETAPAVEVDVGGTYDMVGFTWSLEEPVRDHEPHEAFAGPAVQVRGSADGRTWGSWLTLDEIDGPDPDSPEATAARTTLALGPAFLGPFRKLQVRWRSPEGSHDPPRATVLDLSGHTAGPVQKLGAILSAMMRPGGPREAEAEASSPQPSIISRAGWGADESIRRGDPAYGKVRAAIVHHTVSTNSYSPSDSAAIVRGIYQFHVQTNGWSDIGYNFLIDRYGQIFEGRYGGVDKAVIGAHSWGSNSQTTGIAIIGTYSSVSLPPAAYDAMVRLLDWKLDVHSVDPVARTQFVRADGVPLDIRTVSGHRDAFPTSCPGDGIYSQLDSAAAQAKEMGGQKIFGLRWSPEEATWTGTGHEPARLTGYLKYPAPWNVRILGPGGNVLSTFSGSGQNIDVTWSSRGPGGVALADGTYRALVETAGSRTYDVPIDLRGGPRFEEWLLLYNPGDATAQATISLASNDGEVARPTVEVPPRTRRTLYVNAVSVGRELAARVDSDRPVVAERAMYFNYGGRWDGGHAQAGVVSPATEWYFAEGYTAVGFEEYLTLYNPTDTDAMVSLDYLFNPSGSLNQSVSVPPRSRATVHVNSVVGPGREVAIAVRSDVPIVAERPQYFDYNGQRGGDVVLGAKELATEWNFAEGYTGGGFTTYLTLANPTRVDASATVEFFGNTGIIRTLRGVRVRAKGRTTLRVDDYVGDGKEVSVRVVTDRPIVVERPVYFGYGKPQSRVDGGHVAFGATSPRTSYFFAEGYTALGFDEYVTLLNPGTEAIRVEVEYSFPSSPPSYRSYSVQPKARYTIAVHDEVARAGEVSVKLSSSRPFFAERPMYFSYRGVWKGGSVVQGGAEPSTRWYFAEGYTGN